MCDFSSEGPVVHEQDVEFLCIVDDKLLETVGKVEFGGVV